jgi:hypothetical protein
MLAIVVLVPLAHGGIVGPWDELSLCLTPVVVTIFLLIVKLWQGRAERRYDRMLRRQGLSKTGKTRRQR